MIIHSLHPTPAPGLRVMARLAGTGGSARAVADAVLTRESAILADWAMDGAIGEWYANEFDQVISRKGLAPRKLVESKRAEYEQLASELEDAGCPVAPFLWSNPEAAPDLQCREKADKSGWEGIPTALAARLRNPIKRLLLPRVFQDLDPATFEQWHPKYFETRRKVWDVLGAGYYATWLRIIEPITKFARFHAISSGGMSGGVPRWTTVDYNGWENLPIPGVGSPQCYLNWKGGADNRLQTGQDPKWLSLLLYVDCLRAIPGAVPIVTDPSYSDVTTWHLAIYLAFARAMGVRDGVYYSERGYAGTEVAAALAEANDWTIDPSARDGLPIGPIDLMATELHINGVSVTRDEYLAHFGS